MGLAAFKREFEQAVELSPVSLRLDLFPKVDLQKRHAEVRELASNHLANMSAWHSDMLKILRRLKRLIAEFSADGAVSELRDIGQQIPGWIVRLDERIERYSENLQTAEVAIDILLQVAADTNVSAEALQRMARTRDDVVAVCSKVLEMFEDIRNRTKSIEWDLDPEAHGGSSFSIADELLSHLSR